MDRMRSRQAARHEPDAGFTLVELLVVMVVLAILAAVAIPVFLNQRNKAWDTDAKSVMRTASLALLSNYLFSDGEAFSKEAVVMAREQPTVRWVESFGQTNNNDSGVPLGAVAFEWGDYVIGVRQKTAVLAMRSQSGRCFYQRLIQDVRAGPVGSTYLSAPGPCRDPWEFTSAINQASY